MSTPPPPKSNISSPKLSSHSPSQVPNFASHFPSSSPKYIVIFSAHVPNYFTSTVVTFSRPKSQNYCHFPPLKSQVIVPFFLLKKQICVAFCLSIPKYNQVSHFPSQVPNYRSKGASKPSNQTWSGVQVSLLFPTGKKWRKFVFFSGWGLGDGTWQTIWYYETSKKWRKIWDFWQRKKLYENVSLGTREHFYCRFFPSPIPNLRHFLPLGKKNTLLNTSSHSWLWRLGSPWLHVCSPARPTTISGKHSFGTLQLLVSHVWPTTGPTFIQ